MLRERFGCHITKSCNLHVAADEKLSQINAAFKAEPHIERSRRHLNLRVAVDEKLNQVKPASKTKSHIACSRRHLSSMSRLSRFFW